MGSQAQRRRIIGEPPKWDIPPVVQQVFNDVCQDRFHRARRNLFQHVGHRIHVRHAVPLWERRLERRL